MSLVHKYFTLHIRRLSCRVQTKRAGAGELNVVLFEGRVWFRGLFSVPVPLPRTLSRSPLSPSCHLSAVCPGGAVPSSLEENLCRICMDSPIDCVLLECGHMVTCTKCGKRMNECPICRQYVIRAVHVFRS